MASAKPKGSQKTLESKEELVIKSAEAYRLAHELAKAGGLSVTEVILDGLYVLREREALTQKWLEIGQQIRKTLPPELLVANPAELLYDAQGLPK